MLKRVRIALTALLLLAAVGVKCAGHHRLYGR